jgi:hypothetical protein
VVRCLACIFLQSFAFLLIMSLGFGVLTSSSDIFCMLRPSLSSLSRTCHYVGRAPHGRIDAARPFVVHTLSLSSRLFSLHSGSTAGIMTSYRLPVDVKPTHYDVTIRTDHSIAWNPRNERMFASCGDDRSIRILMGGASAIVRCRDIPPKFSSGAAWPGSDWNGNGKTRQRWDDDGVESKLRGRERK